jgi:hypothetical protein
MIQNKVFYILPLFLMQLALAFGMTTSNYEGSYHLAAVYNKDNMGIELPSLEYTIRLQKKRHEDDSDIYSMEMRIGNSIGAQLAVMDIVDEPSTVTVGGLVSTRMLPSPEIYQVETAISDVLKGTSTTIRFKNEADSTQHLIIEGSNGAMECKRIE